MARVAGLQHLVASSAKTLKLRVPSGVLALNETTSVQHLKGSGQAEFTTFMRNYQDMVFSTAARLVGRDAQAEDIAQDVFVRAYEHFEVLRTSSSAGGWLKTVTTNLALNHLTRHRRRWRLFSELMRPHDEDPPGDAPGLPLDPGEWAGVDVARAPDLDADTRRVLIDRALRRLPDHQRVPLVLYHFDDLSYPEIADRLQVSVGKIKTDIRRGRLALAPLLKELQS